MPQIIAAIIHPKDTEPDEGATAVKRYNRIDYELIRHRRSLCVIQVETRMEKRAMSEQHMKHTEWNYIIWFTLLRRSDRISKLRLTKLQTASVNS